MGIDYLIIRMLNDDSKSENYFFLVTKNQTKITANKQTKKTMLVGGGTRL